MPRILYLLLFVFPFWVYSQVGVKKAKKAYSDFDYYKVVDLASKNNLKDIEFVRVLADSYKRTGNLSKSEKLYGIVSESEQKTAEDFYNYAQILKTNSKYTEATEAMEAFAKLNSEDGRVELFELNKKYYEELLKDKKQFVVSNVSGNSFQQDFGLVYYKNKILFVSSRQPLGYLTHIWNGNRLPYVDMYTGKITAKNELKSVRKFPEFNKKYHDGPASFNTKGNYIVFSSDNYSDKSKDGVRLLALYESTYEKGEWTEKKSLPFTSGNYSCGHPALTADGNTLYFASDMPGGFGKTDIYKCTKSEKRKWSSPINLGENINTEGDEMFPFIHESGLFFFASNGRPGLGGLDIFVAMAIDDFYSKSINVGVPANSTKDDFSMILDAEKKKGFFSSDRDEGKGNDDIYSFELLKPFNFGKIIKGVIKDETGEVINEAAIFLVSKYGKLLTKVCTKKDGSFVLFANDYSDYKIEVKKEDYFNTKKNVSTAVPENTIAVNMVMRKIPDVTLVALVTDGKTKKPIEKVKLTFTDEGGKATSSITTSNGEFKMDLFDKKIGDSLNYTIEINKSGYVTKTINMKWAIKKLGEQKIHEKLNVDLSKIELGGDLAKMSNLGNIYFDLAKFNIRADAAGELDKIVKIMNENLEMVVELGSHTDCRSGKQSNLALSDKRAKSSVDYIKKRIQNPTRISGKGYGESKLLNKCACEGPKPSPCNEEEHAKNRRTEFIILKVAN